jgi:hypothetical protein
MSSIHDRAVADEIEHRIEVLGLGQALGKARSFQLDALDAQRLQHGEALAAARGRDHPRARIDGHVDRGLAEGRG